MIRRLNRLLGLAWLKRTILGRRRNPLEPGVFERLSLVAFLAWVGLGADGLSSACYGPEAAYLALGEHRSLAPWLALMTAFTVATLSAAYSSTIEAFPSGGGGYVVATHTLGRIPGVFCGGALVIDYVLTVGISIAAGADAILSFFPPEWYRYKVFAALGGVAFLTLLNFRGVRESVLLLVPIFLAFVASHALLIGLGILREGAPLRPEPPTAPVASLGAAGTLLLLLKAYAHGAGTYTGIEAVSNSLTILREPRVHTARRAMLYMAVSLSLIAGGLLVGYLHTGIAAAGHKTLNASLAEAVFGAGAVGRALVLATLLSEALLLVAAAQTGFIDGPRVLASMAVDSWVPRWFSRLSDRLVVANGVFLIGLGGIAAILLTLGDVQKLVILYSFCVFTTFLLSQAGMTRYWIRHKEAGWVRRSAASATATLLAVAVLGTLLATYGAGVAGMALAALLALSGLCLLIRRHYRHVSRRLHRLRVLIDAAENDPHRAPLRRRDPAQPTAVFLVTGYGGPGLHTLLAALSHFPDYFHQMVFVSVGLVDFDRFKGRREISSLNAMVDAGLNRYVEIVQRWGYRAEGRSALGVDAVDELERLCLEVARDYPRAIFFCGDLIYRIPSFLTRLLHERTAEELQRRLHMRGLPILILPIRVD